MPQPLEDTIVDEADDRFYITHHTKDFARVSTTNDTFMFYRRDTFAQTIETLGANSFVVVVGPPGCGKSSAAWVDLTLSAHDAPDHHLVWIDISLNRVSTIHRNTIVKSKVVPSQLTIKSFILEESYPSIVVLDGLREQYLLEWKEICQELMEYTVAKKILRFQVITSLQTSVPAFMEKEKPAIFEVNPWSEVEYYAAIENDDFWNIVKSNLGAVEGQDLSTAALKQALLKSKCNYSGSSARWTFDYTIKEVIQEVQRHVRKISNFSDCFALNMGEASPHAINHLFCTLDGTRQFTSALVARTIASNLKTSTFYQQATIHAKLHNNPSFDGHVLEMDFLNALEYNSLVRVSSIVADVDETAANSVDTTFTYTFNRIQHVRYAADGLPSLDPETTYSSYVKHRKVVRFERDVLGHPLSQMQLMEGLVMIPQGAFDAAQFIASSTTPGKLKYRSYQVTRAGSHDIKVHFMRNFRAHIEQDLISRNIANPAALFDEKMEVVVVVPQTAALAYRRPERWNMIGDSHEEDSQIDKFVAAFTRADTV